MGVMGNHTHEARKWIFPPVHEHVHGGATPGLQEGLRLMNEDARFELVVLPELAWGKHGVGSKIDPNAVPVFDLLLLEARF